MLKWFGTSDQRSQEEMRRVINGVHRLLTNVDYVYPGSRCRSNVFAYVFPNPPHNKNANGKYIFNLCSLYMKSSLQEQIETLVHEGSHHQTMRTNDVCYSGSGSGCSKAYGRSICQKLAKAAPSRALKNADNFCYFVNDAYEAKGGGTYPAPNPFTYSSPRRRAGASTNGAVPASSWTTWVPRPVPAPAPLPWWSQPLR